MELTEKQKEIARFILEHCSFYDLECIMYCKEFGLIMAEDNAFYMPDGNVASCETASLQAFAKHFKGTEGELKIWKKDVAN